MKHRTLAVWLLLPLLASCGNAKDVTIAAYFAMNEKTPLVYRDGFKVLQLTDIHWSVNTNAKVQGEYLTRVVKEANPDFIMITGDSLLGATTSTAETLMKVIESWQIPYGTTFGNHDREGEYSPEWLTQLWSSGKYSYYNEVQDNVFGRSNYVIPLTDGAGKPVWNLYSIDSNSYPESKNGVYYDYDVIHTDQVEWFKATAAESKRLAGATVPGLAYFHIPLFEYCYQYVNEHKNNTQPVLGEILETSSFSTAPEEIKKLFADAGMTTEDIKFWPGYMNTGFFDAGVANGVQGFFCGHDHSNDWGDYYTSTAGKGYVSYGVKSGTELYYTHSDKRNVDLIGGSLVTLRGNHFDLEHIYVPTDPAAAITRSASISIEVNK
jgi:3',5'-cyclic AMP phosphodiesterase CpdA